MLLVIPHHLLGISMLIKISATKRGTRTVEKGDKLLDMVGSRPEPFEVVNYMAPGFEADNLHSRNTTTAS